MIVAGWQYLRQPEEVAAKLPRVLRPGCQLIVAFSNRLFAQKAPRIWIDGGDRDHLAVVAQALVAQGWPLPQLIAGGHPSRPPFQELPEPGVAQARVSQLEGVPSVGSCSDRPMKVSLLPSQLSTLLAPEA